ncbi:hypothetical protein BDW59DRAFT_156641 [Aspergillus cavernicola]|uniref:Uncharacterized protein n=1 Tax=Aspergillus cavernicola TaxID=176166 RepID=A0ABR4J1J3_9EURO
MDQRCPPPFLEEPEIPSQGGYLVDDHDAIGWAGIDTLIVTTFMLLTFAILPEKLTTRHYFTTNALTGISLMSLAFIIPSKSQPQQCYDDITSHNAISSLDCRATSATLFLDLFRSISLHLNVCWESKPGPIFMISTLIFTYGGSISLVIIGLSIASVSYQVSKVWFLNHMKSTATSWGPILEVVITLMVV